MNDDIYKRIYKSHPGWIDHEENERKTHYYIKEDEDWYIAICGELTPDRDLLNRWDDNYSCNSQIDTICKNCLKSYKKLKHGGTIKIKLKGMLI